MIEKIYNLYKKHFLIDTDTRKIRNNSIFFALKGESFNGNEFAEQAIEKGAIYSIVDEEKYVTNSNIILVDDVLKTLQNLANYHRQQLNIPIIALTGSNGKTTTKELIASVLSEKFKITATKGNLNNHIGVPLTLLSMTEDTEIGVVEMGANHLKEIAFLSKIAMPDYGYITNFGKAHLEGFGSVEGVIKAKSELYDYLIEHKKHIFINPKDEIQLKNTNKADRIFFDTEIEFTEVNPFVKLKYKSIEMQSNLIGKYNYTNIAAAITIGNYFGVSVDAIKNAIETYKPKNNRSQIVKTSFNEIVLDAYNANPTSMKVALESFNLTPAIHKVVILGDMFEVGSTSDIEHQKVVDFVTELGFDNAFFVGNNFYKTVSKFNHFKTVGDLKAHLKKNPVKNSHILIKGSRGMTLEKVLEFI